MRSFTAHWLGRIGYGAAHALQERLLAARVAGTVGDTLLLLEHSPVVTLGRCDVRRYVRDLARIMIALAHDRGVEASFLEGDPKLVGVWVDEASPAAWPGDPREGGGAARPAKIGAIGVRISRWVTMHGFAFNVSTDLAGFRLIVPCGITQYGVTSLAALGQSAPSVEEVGRASVAHFARVFEAEATMAGAAETERLASSAG
jgi:lipoyl(octanoyl) transferase